jgi:hypothetical protein
MESCEIPRRQSAAATAVACDAARRVVYVRALVLCPPAPERGGLGGSFGPHNGDGMSMRFTPMSANELASTRMLAKCKKHLVFVAIILLAFALRMWGVDARSLWFDESFEYWASVVGLQDLPATVVASFQPPLYNLLLHFWVSLGSSAIWLRFLSVALSILSLLGVMIVGYELFGLKGAAASGLLMAILPTEIKYAQEAAEYALMSFALSWSLVALFRALRVSSWKTWGLWGIFCTVAVYSHYGAGITVLAVSVLVVIESIWERKLDMLGKQVGAALLGLVLGLPLLRFLPKQSMAQQTGRAVLGMSLFYELRDFIANTGRTFLFPLTGSPFSPIPEWLAPLCAGGILCLSPVMLLSRSGELKRLFVWFWGAYLAYYWAVGTSLYAYGNYGFRYMLVLLPLFVLVIVAVVLELYESRLLIVKATGVGLLCLITTCALCSLPNRQISQITRGDTAWPETEDMREVVSYWGQHPSQRAPTYIYYGAAPAFRYYARLYGFERDVSLPAVWFFSCWRGSGAEYCVVDNVYYGAGLRPLPLDDKISSVQKTFDVMPERFWLVFSHIHAGEDKPIVEGFLSDYRVEDAFRRVGAVAYLLTEEN